MLLWGVIMVSPPAPPSPCALLRSFQTAQGLVRNYGQLLGEIHRTPCVPPRDTPPPGMRWLLGVFEAGLFPGVSYLLSWCVAVIALNSNSAPFSWYKRSEFGIRIALFFSAASVSGAFGGLLAVCGTRNFLEIPLIWVPTRSQSRRWTGSAGSLVGHGYLFWKV